MNAGLLKQTELSEKEFNAVLDRYLVEKNMDCEAYEKMSEKQRDLIQAIKRSYKRIEARRK